MIQRRCVVVVQARSVYSAIPTACDFDFQILFITLSFCSSGKHKKCMNKFDCLVNEMLCIQELKPTLNVQSDSLRAKVFK